MRVRLAVAALVNSVFTYVQANMAAEARWINMGILFTNRKLPSIHSESVPKIRSKPSTYSYTEKEYDFHTTEMNRLRIRRTFPRTFIDLFSRIVCY